MCHGAFYSEERQKEIEVMQDYAVEILRGKSVEELASSREKAVEDIINVLKDIKNINPALYFQLKEVLGDEL